MNPETPAQDITSVQPPEPAPPVATTPPEGGIVLSPSSPPQAPEPPAAVAPPAAPAPPAPVPAQAAAAAPPTPTPPPAKVMDTSWPFQGYSGPQPWEADNTPTLTQNHLMLSSGSSGPEVVELAALLGELGYATNITAGQNPHAIYDQGISAAVQSFCRDYGVAEDPAVRRARTEDTVGPWIWEALTRAVHKARGARVLQPSS